MTVKTKSVTNRHPVSYQSYDDLLADAEDLARQHVTTLGNWSFAQILDHLAISLEGSIDGMNFKAPWPLRVVGKMFLKNKFLNNPLSPGFQIPNSVKPKVHPRETVSLEAALDHPRQAVARCTSEPHRADHPLFDDLSREEWDRFSFRHAEMHMSFVQPGSA